MQQKRKKKDLGKRIRRPTLPECPTFHVAYLVSRLPLPCSAEGTFTASPTVGPSLQVAFHARVTEVDGFLTLKYKIGSETHEEGFGLRRVNWWKKFWRIKCTCRALVAKLYLRDGVFRCRSRHGTINQKLHSVNKRGRQEIINRLTFARNRSEKLSALYDYLDYVRRAKIAIMRPRYGRQWRD